MVPKNIQVKIKKIFPLTIHDLTGFAAVTADGNFISWGGSLNDSKKIEFNSEKFPELTDVQDFKMNSAGAWAALKADGTLISGVIGDEGVKVDSLRHSDIVDFYPLKNGIVARSIEGVLVAWGEKECIDKIPNGMHAVKKIVVQPDGADCSGAVIKTDGAVVSWNEPYYELTPDPSQLANVVDISAGGSGYAALKEDGTVVTWADVQPLPVEPLTDVVEVLGNYNGFVARKRDGSVIFWAKRFGAEIQGDWTKIISIKKVAGGFLGLREDGTIAVYGQKDEFNGFEAIKNVELIPDQSAASDRFLVRKANNNYIEFGRNVTEFNSEDLENIEVVQSSSNLWSAIKADGSLYRWGDYYGYQPYQNGRLKSFNAHGGVRKQTDQFIIYNDDTLIDPSGNTIANIADFAIIGRYTDGRTFGRAALNVEGVLDLKYSFYDSESKLLSETHEEISNVKYIVQGDHSYDFVYFVLNDDSVWRYDGLRYVKVFNQAGELKLLSESVGHYGVLFSLLSDGKVAYDDPMKRLGDGLIEKIQSLSNVTKMYDHFLFKRADNSLVYCGDFFGNVIEFGKVKQLVTTKYSAGVITAEDKLVVLPFAPSSFYSSFEGGIFRLMPGDDAYRAKNIVDFNDMLLIQLENDRWEYVSLLNFPRSILDVLNARPGDIVKIIPGSYRSDNYGSYQIDYEDGAVKIFDYYGEKTAYSGLAKSAIKIERDPVQDLWLLHLEDGSVVPIDGSGLNLIEDNARPIDLVSNPIYLN
jgi:hypothetical protein